MSDDVASIKNVFDEQNTSLEAENERLDVCRNTACMVIPESTRSDANRLPDIDKSLFTSILHILLELIVFVYTGTPKRDPVITTLLDMIIMTYTKETNKRRARSTWSSKARG